MCVFVSINGNLINFIFCLKFHFFFSSFFTSSIFVYNFIFFGTTRCAIQTFHSPGKMQFVFFSKFHTIYIQMFYSIEVIIIRIKFNSTYRELDNNSIKKKRNKFYIIVYDGIQKEDRNNVKVENADESKLCFEIPKLSSYFQLEGFQLIYNSCMSANEMNTILYMFRQISKDVQFECAGIKRIDSNDWNWNRKIRNLNESI